MYEGLKQFVTGLIPRSWLIKMEPTLRWWLYLGYRGKRYQCPVCEKGLSQFIALPTGDRLCPRCGSLGRTRRLWTLLEDDILTHPGMRLLHFSPARPLYRKLRKHEEVEYLSSDFEGEFEAQLSLDLTDTGLESDHFDRIICYHVLEHITEDRKAMAELFRIVKPGGKVYLQTPFQEGEIYEDFSITSPEDRLKHFGQKDHVRIYSAEGLQTRLEEAGFKVEILTFTQKPAEARQHGLSRTEKVLLATKA